MIYLDNAATSGKKPQSVINATIDALTQYSANPGRSGHNLSVKTSMAVYNSRVKIKELINSTSEGNVCFTLNCTMAINMVLFGVLNSGDHVIISSLEHNAVYRPINYLNRDKGLEYDIARVNLYNDDKTLENIIGLIKPNTKMIFVTSASNVIGKTLPLEKIGKLCNEKGILFGVDAAQGCGIFDINMQKMHIDYLCLAPHKGLYSSMGTGVLIAEKPIDNILISGGTGINSKDPFQPDDLPERLESGTQNVPGIYSISAGIDFVKKTGMNKIYEHEMNLCKMAYSGLRKVGATLYTPYPEKNSYAPVLSFNIKGKHSSQTAEILNANGVAVRSGLHCAPLAHEHIGTSAIGTVRISPSVFNSAQDIDNLIFVLKRIK